MRVCAALHAHCFGRMSSTGEYVYAYVHRPCYRRRDLAAGTHVLDSACRPDPVGRLFHLSHTLMTTPTRREATPSTSSLGTLALDEGTSAQTLDITSSHKPHRVRRRCFPQLIPHTLLPANTAPFPLSPVHLAPDESTGEHGRGKPRAGHPGGGPGDQLRRAEGGHRLRAPGGADGARGKAGARCITRVSGIPIAARKRGWHVEGGDLCTSLVSHVPFFFSLPMLFVSSTPLCS